MAKETSVGDTIKGLFLLGIFVFGGFAFFCGDAGKKAAGVSDADETDYSTTRDLNRGSWPAESWPFEFDNARVSCTYGGRVRVTDLDHRLILKEEEGAFSAPELDAFRKIAGCTPK